MTPNPDEYPPQFRERETGGYDLVTDEPEWLARPAPWAIRELGDQRKLNLYWYHLQTRLAARLACGSCRELVFKIITEEGTVAPDDIPPFHFPVPGQNAFQRWYDSQHTGGKCEAWQVLRIVSMFKQGIITNREMFNNVLESLNDDEFRASRTDPTSHQIRKSWERDISLEMMGPNPFRPVVFAPEWRTSSAVGLARTMYDGRDFAAMPVLADALEEAGCDEPAVLGHCRGPGPHVRGCWVVDGVLGLG
jgi:hypothetical protein